MNIEQPSSKTEESGAAGISTDHMRKHMQEMALLASEIDPGSLFVGRKANRWMELAQKRPIPQMLFGQLWFETELCILFADTNLGKSILAVQIADSISRGIPVNGFMLESKKQPVLYFDFELTDKQFENRYSENFTNHYLFDDNLIRLEFNPDSVAEEMLFEESLEKMIIKHHARVLIIDNITYLKNENEKARDALPLMKQLKSLKTKYNLSILVLAHTPKRDLSKPITRNDLQGSKMLINFCDSAWAIGESTADKNIRYIKQIKARNCELIYDAGNIALFEIIKPGNYLHFNFLGYANELSHLKITNPEEQDELEEKILSILKETPSASGYSIAKQLCPDGTNFNSFNVKVARVIKRLHKANRI